MRINLQNGILGGIRCRVIKDKVVWVHPLPIYINHADQTAYMFINNSNQVGIDDFIVRSIGKSGRWSFEICRITPGGDIRECPPESIVNFHALHLVLCSDMPWIDKPSAEETADALRNATLVEPYVKYWRHIHDVADHLTPVGISTRMSGPLTDWSLYTTKSSGVEDHVCNLIYGQLSSLVELAGDVNIRITNLQLDREVLNATIKKHHALKLSMIRDAAFNIFSTGNLTFDDGYYRVIIDDGKYCHVKYIVVLAASDGDQLPSRMLDMMYRIVHQGQVTTHEYWHRLSVDLYRAQMAYLRERYIRIVERSMGSD